MSRQLKLAGLAAATLLLAQIAGGGIAQAESWKRLAIKDVSPSRQTGSIDLSATKGKYKALRIYARRSRISLNGVKVIYARGRPHFESRDITLLPGERTKPINPTTKGRFLKRLEYSYTARRGARRQPRLVVWGLQAPGDANARRDKTLIGGTSAAGPGAAEGPPETDRGTVLFGVKTVSFSVDHGVIAVGREIGKFEQIRLLVKNNDLHINEVTVTYGNGQADSLTYGANVPAGSRTKWLKLKGNRFIKQIELKYQARPGFKGRARVEVYGRYAKGWLDTAGAGKTFNRGWVYLGGQSPLFFSIRKGLGYEKRIVEVGTNKGGFSQIRVDVRNRAITLREMTVVYGDDAVDIIPVKKKISAGDSYGPVDLQGDGKRAIKEIQVRYRSRIFDSKAQGTEYAFVEFWAKH